jgi:3'(2'), 5'-bisphosphate nucleotidase
LRRPAPSLDSSRVLDLIDRGRSAPAERFWTLDPVDGTKGFVRGDHYVVALALIVEGRVEIGLLGCPELSWRDGEQQGVGSIAYAIREHGAFRSSLTREDFIPLQVSSCREPRSARVLRSFEAEHIDLDTFNAIVQRLGVETPPTLMDSQLKHLVVAAGEADVLIRVPATESFREKTWDQAAGCLIVEEAGGQATDLAGAALDFSTGRLLVRNRGVIVSNGRLHDAILDAVRAVATDSPNDANRRSGALS